MVFNQSKIIQIIQKQISKKFPGVVLGLAYQDQVLISAQGNLKRDSQYFIASATKLYTTALILMLVDQNKIKLTDTIGQYLDTLDLSELFIFKTQNYIDQITIEHLLSHTSGLPDYFQSKNKGKALIDDILSGQDRFWDLKMVLSASKKIGMQFSPFSEKALYSDTNYQLLGRIIENIFQMKFSQAVQNFICSPLGLHRTYVYSDSKDVSPVSLNYKDNALQIPLAMTSFQADGGIVSTVDESLIFLQAFFSGRLFNKQHIQLITKKWRNIFFPLKYGIGISLFRLPWFFSPFKKYPDLIGHSGLSGAFYYYVPQKDIYIVGTVNQIDQPQASFRLMLKVIDALI